MVGLVILIFLWHIPSALIPILTIPIAVLISFIPMHAMGMSSNIMSLGGIAIAVGAMVDAAIVVVEQTHKKLEGAGTRVGRTLDYQQAIVSAVKEVGGPSFFALLVIAVSFLPVLTLEAQEGRLFKPLAYTKNFAMVMAAVLAITLDPALRLFFFRKDNFRIPGFRRQDHQRRSGRQDSLRREAPDQPLPHATLRAGGARRALRWKWLVIAGALGHDRGHGSDLSKAGQRVHAAAGRGRAVLHADHAARHLGYGSAAPDAGAGPHSDALPRSGRRARQIGPRGNLDRPGALLHDGDRDPAQAQIGVAQGGDLVRPVAAPAASLPGAHHARSHSHRAAGGRDGPRAADSRAYRTPGPCRSRTASTC